MKVSIERAAVLDGEDLMDFANKLARAAYENASVFGAEPGNIYMVAGYKDSVVVRDMAKYRFVQAKFKRKGEDEFSFSKPMIVRRSWEIVRALDDEGDVKREDELQMDEVQVSVPRFWEGVL